MDPYRIEGELRKLEQQITDWNSNRLDLFEISAPNEHLEFYGVIRFFYQEPDSKVITKCVRVSSMATTHDVVDILVEKFRPDMRMLTAQNYGLHEVHANGEERMLTDKERPLMVQLHWGIDDREGRFLLKNEGMKTPALHSDMSTTQEPIPFKRKLSKREKKELKKKEKEGKLNKENQKEPAVAEKLYNDLPDGGFTRTISNPEMVMKKRRQLKLEKKLADIRNKDDQGGTLKIYGDSISPDVPYKTLLLSTQDTAQFVVQETLSKYGLENERLENYCLLKVVLPPGAEFTGGPPVDQRNSEVLDDADCPLALLLDQLRHDVQVVFKLVRRTADMQPRKRAEKPREMQQPIVPPPYLVEINPDGTEPHKAPKHNIVEFSEIGSDPNSGGNPRFVKLIAQDILPRHCVVQAKDGVASIQPVHREAEVVVNNRRIADRTAIKHGDVVRIGRMYLFRFMDPAPPPEPKRQQNYEDEAVHNRLVQPQRVEPPLALNKAGVASDHRGSPHEQTDLLPALLEFYENVEDHFLSLIINQMNPQNISFKLAPTYSLYMAVRYRAAPVFRPGITADERQNWIIGLCNKLADMLYYNIQDVRDGSSYLSFWMANASELLHFFKQDVELCGLTGEAQSMIAEAVQLAFQSLVQCLQRELNQIMMAFLDDSTEDLNEEELRASSFPTGRPLLSDVLNVLSSAMSMLRRCRVNAALTIQLFSQLFHFINMWLFNKLVLEPHLGYCTSDWGHRLKRRLGRLEAWAEKQGLELAADCHLSRIIQAAHLLESPKRTPDNILNISSTCFKLNSLQLRVLLENYRPRPPQETHIPPELINRVVSVAQNTADELARSEGRPVRLEEDPDLQLPFLLPEDGYSCDHVRGIPNGLADFLEPITQAQVCRLLVNNQASGAWNVYMRSQDATLPRPQQKVSPPAREEPMVELVSLDKFNGSLGLSIVAATGEGQKDKGIYIKSVVKGGGAERDGRLKAGDQLLEVDGQSLVSVSQEQAAGLMTRTGNRVNLRVAKQAAIYHGLATILNQPSPPAMQRNQTPQQVPLRPQDLNGMQGYPADAYGTQPRQPGRGLQQAMSATNVTSYEQQRGKPPPQGYPDGQPDPRSKSATQLNQAPYGQPSGTLPRQPALQGAPPPNGPYFPQELGRHVSQPNLHERDEPHAPKNYPSGPNLTDYVNQQEMQRPHGSSTLPRNHDRFQQQAAQQPRSPQQPQYGGQQPQQQLAPKAVPPQGRQSPRGGAYEGPGIRPGQDRGLGQEPQYTRHDPHATYQNLGPQRPNYAHVEAQRPNYPPAEAQRPNYAPPEGQRPTYTQAEAQRSNYAPVDTRPKNVSFPPPAPTQQEVDFPPPPPHLMQPDIQKAGSPSNRHQGNIVSPGYQGGRQPEPIGNYQNYPSPTDTPYGHTAPPKGGTLPRTAGPPIASSAQNAGPPSARSFPAPVGTSQQPTSSILRNRHSMFVESNQQIENQKVVTRTHTATSARPISSIETSSGGGGAKIPPPVPKKPLPAIAPKPKINIAAEIKKGFSSSAWVREEREQEMKRREEERRQQRVEEIRYLQSLPSLTQQQQERLKRLHLDDEFDKRVLEMDNNKTDDEDDDIVERPATKMKLLQQQRAATKPHANYTQPPQQPQYNQPQQPYNHQPQQQVPYSQPAQQPPYNHPQQAQNYPQQPQYNHQPPQSQPQYNHIPDQQRAGYNPDRNTTTQPPQVGYTNNNNHQQQPDFNRGYNPERGYPGEQGYPGAPSYGPPPPERKSSYQVVSQQQHVQESYNSRYTGPVQASKKSVSFHSNLAVAIDDEDEGTL